MPKIFTAKMTKRIQFDIKANSLEEAQDWCQTHDFADVQNESTYWDIEYSEEVGELEDDGYVAIDISDEEYHENEDE